MKLTKEDAAQLKALCRWVDKHDKCRPENWNEILRERESELSPVAYRWWFYRSSDDLRSELKRWVRYYSVEKTRAGYRVFRWIECRGRYARRALAGRLTEEQAESYRDCFYRVRSGRRQLNW